MNDFNIKPQLIELAYGRELSKKEMQDIFGAILENHITPSQIGAFLMGLETNGLSVDAIVAGASVMRSKMIKVDVDFETIDVCGTGGDGAHSLNISTAVSFVLAGCGLKIAKHGNRSMSSICGAADVLEALGVNLVSDSKIQKKALEDANIAFFFAPNHHPKLAYVGPIRRELGFGTIFNLLGPLCNPTSASKQLLGVYRPKMLDIIANALKDLGANSAWVIHGSGGLDEFAIDGVTKVAALKNGNITHFEFTPEDAGLRTQSALGLKGGDAKFNSTALLNLLNGEKSIYRDCVVLNSAAALVMAGNADDLKMGTEIANASIDTQCALQALNQLIAITNGKSS